MTTEAELIEELRVAVGNPDPNDVTPAELRPRLVAGLEFLASELEYSVVEDGDLLALTADIYNYDLPSDCSRVLAASWNGNWLTGASTAEWRRSETNWMTATSANPSEYAIEGRTLVLYPPPSSAAVTTASALVLRYARIPPALSASGPEDLLDADARVAVYYAAVEYLGPRNADGSKDRLLTHATNMLKLLLGQAHRRDARAPADFQARVIIGQRRRGPAR